TRTCFWPNLITGECTGLRRRQYAVWRSIAVGGPPNSPKDHCLEASLRTYLKTLSVLWRTLLVAATGPVLYQLFWNSQLFPGLPQHALDDLNMTADYWLDRMLQTAGLTGSATASWALVSLSDYAFAILLLAGAALLYLMQGPAVWLLTLSLNASTRYTTAQFEPGTDCEPAADGVSAFTTLLGLHGVAADQGQIR